ncbi:hypothetical protein D3C78_1923940 [compost metagenome]
MIRPQPLPPSAACMAGSTRRVVWKALDRLMARMASQRSGAKSSMGATCWMPALFTRMSIWPKLRTL